MRLSRLFAALCCAALVPVTQAAESVVMFQKQNRVSALCQSVGRGKPSQTGADYDHIVFVKGLFQWDSHFIAGNRLNLQFGENVLVDHGNTAQHGPDDSQKSLIGAGQHQVIVANASVTDFSRTAVDRAPMLSGKSFNGERGEKIGEHNMI